MFRTFDSSAQPVTNIYYDYTLHVLLHKSPTPTPKRGLWYRYCSCNIGIAAAILISQSHGMELWYTHLSPTPTWNGDCNIDITAVISPSVPNHPHAVMLKILLTITAETMMWLRQAFMPSQPLTAHTNSQCSYTKLRAILPSWMFKVCCIEHENS